MHRLFKIITLTLFVFCTGIISRANKVDQELILKSGPYKAELESKFACTLHKLHYKGKALLVNSGWMGSVIKCKVPKGQEPFIGTGHGGEVVKSIQVFANGKKINIVQKSQIVSGQVIKVIKDSTIGPLLHHSEITLTPEGLKQSFKFEVNGDMSKVEFIYLFMSIWNKSMNKYLAASKNEPIQQGTFIHNNKFIQTRLCNWVALLNPKTGIGGLCTYSLPKSYKSFFWDRSKDNKHYIKYYPSKQKGSKFECEAYIQAIETNINNFQNDVIKKLIPTEDKALSEKALMKNIKGPKNFSIESPASNGKSINASNFGFSTSAKATDNAKALQKAIDFCRQNKISKLLITKGKYHLLKSNVDSFDKTKKLSHHSNRIFTVNLIGMQDFILDGQGSEFIFEDISLPRGKEKLGAFFRLYKCSRVKIKNLVIDWNWEKMPLGFLGKIKKVDRKNFTVDYDVSYNGKGIPLDYHVYAVRGWDKTINNRTTKAFEFWWKTAKDHKMVDSNTLRFTFKNAYQIRKAQEGMWAIFKTKTHFFAAGFVVDDNEHLSFDNIKIYGVPSSGMWSRRNKYMEIVNCKIMPRPGTEKVWASHSGLEIHNSLGYFKMENNHLEFTHDDGLHFSDYFLGGGIKKTGPKTVDILNLMFWQAGDAFVVGDTYEFRNRDYSPTGFSAKLKSFKWTIVKNKTAKHFVSAEFDREIPDSLKNDTIIFNVSSYGKGQYIIRNNTFQNILTHGMEVLKPNGLIENNRITNTAYPAIRIHSVIRWTRWHMGHPPRNIIVRNNYIDKANTALRPPADLFIGGGIDPQKGDYYPSPYPIIRNVLVEGNTIKNSQWQAIAVWSAKNIIVRNNSIFAPNRLPSKQRYGGTIDLANVEDIILSNNKCFDDGKAKDKGIYLHRNGCKNVISENNINLDLRTD